MNKGVCEFLLVAARRLRRSRERKSRDLKVNKVQESCQERREVEIR